MLDYPGLDQTVNSGFLLILYGGTRVGLCVLVRRKQWATLLPLLAILGYFFIVCAGAESYSRLRIPLIPFLAILASTGLVALARTIAAHRWRTDQPRADVAPPTPAAIERPQLPLHDNSPRRHR